MLKKCFISIIIFVVLAVITSYTVLFISSSLGFENKSKKSDTTTIAFPTLISPDNATSINSHTKNTINFKPKTIFDVIKKDKTVPATLVACGMPLGIKFFTSGVLVVGIADIPVKGGKSSPAYAAGIRVRDIILKINDSNVNTNEQVEEIISNSSGEKLVFTVKRNSSIFECPVRGVLSTDNNVYQLGMWVRDSTAGIGTITYYNPETKEFAALGHGICDPDTTVLMPLNNADVFSAKINSIIKGEQGAPGELRGKFIEDSLLGSLYSNTNCGIFGTSTKEILGTSYPVGNKSEILSGEAYIYCTINDNPPEKYSISITKINKVFDNNFRDMTIKITDKRLLEETGGIIQGMSGSPIIQNGKIIGAVTHVFVNDPTSGYGIYIENMLYASQSNKKAA